MKHQLLVGLAVFALTNSQVAAIADETIMSTKKSSSAAGEKVDVKHHYANHRGTSGKEWKSTEAADRSKHSATQTSDVTHSDGTVSSRRNHESHSLSDSGETHKVTKDHTAVSPGGTVTKEHSSDIKTDNKGPAASSTDTND